LPELYLGSKIVRNLYLKRIWIFSKCKRTIIELIRVNMYASADLGAKRPFPSPRFFPKKKTIINIYIKILPLIFFFLFQFPPPPKLTMRTPQLGECSRPVRISRSYENSSHLLSELFVIQTTKLMRIYVQASIDLVNNFGAGLNNNMHAPNQFAYRRMDYVCCKA
jgi:hypothetical protein